MDIVTVFCNIDDFYRHLLTAQHPQLTAHSSQSKQRPSGLTLSEIMTIVVFFHASHYRTFKHFYFAHMLTQRRGEFPTLPSYTRFVELIPMTLLPLCAYVQTRKGQPTGIQFIDSLPIRVCHNRRIPSHRVFAGVRSLSEAPRQSTAEWPVRFGPRCKKEAAADDAHSREIVLRFQHCMRKLQGFLSRSCAHLEVLPLFISDGSRRPVDTWRKGHK